MSTENYEKTDNSSELQEKKDKIKEWIKDLEEQINKYENWKISNPELAEKIKVIIEGTEKLLSYNKEKLNNLS